MRRLRSRDGRALPEQERHLRQSHQRVTRVSVLDDLFNPIHGAVLTGADGHVIDGSVSMDRDRYVQRQVSLTLANPDGIWTPEGESSLFYWDKYIRVERGVRVEGVDYFASMGVYLIDEISAESTPDEESFDVKGLDRMDRATRSEFTQPKKYAAGVRVGVAIQDLLEDAGIGHRRWSVDDDGQDLINGRHYEVGDGRLEAATKLAHAFGLEVYANADGFIVVRAAPDLNSLPVAWQFTAGEDAVHLGVSKKWSRDRFYNHILVIGETAKGAVVRAEASDTNPDSPTRVGGPMGDRLFKYKSGMVATFAQAQRVANQLLQKHALIEETVKVNHVPLPILEAGDAIRVTDESTNTNAKYLIKSINTPIAGGEANLEVHKVRNLS